MREGYIKGKKGTLRKRRGRNRRPFQAEWHCRTAEHRSLGRAIDSAGLPIPPHKEQAMARHVAAGKTGPGNRTLASLWSEWR